MCPTYPLALLPSYASSGAGALVVRFMDVYNRVTTKAARAQAAHRTLWEAEKDVQRGEFIPVGDA
jgi:hypothetical protein